MAKTATKKTALITGITGQDGAYLSEFLLDKNYQVVGLYRRSSHDLPNNITHLLSEIKLVKGDLTDPVSLVEAIKFAQPDEIYSLAAQSHVAESWRTTSQTLEVTGHGPLRLFDAVRQVGSNAKIYQASSSEMFGKPVEIPQTEKTPFYPANPYAAFKLMAHNLAHIYRDSYGMFIACGILFNHESPRRGMGFVTQKVAYGAACAKLGIKNSLYLNEENEPIVKNGKLAMGNLESKRDWGFAGDYVEAMWMLLQQKTPSDYIVATGETHTIRELCEEAYRYVGLDYKKYVFTDQKFVRPVETGPLIGDPSKIKRELGWAPKTTFKQLVKIMVDAHLAKLR